MNVFNDIIDGYDSWANLFQSIACFENLIDTIFINEKLPRPQCITNLTPGTNAVFKVDDYVIKIFAPKESTFNAIRDYHQEVKALKEAMKQGINCPNIIASSFIKDKYLFYYIIMDYIEGVDAGRVLPNFSTEEKIVFVRKLQTIIKKFQNINDKEKYCPSLGWRWNQFNPMVKNQVEGILTTLKDDPCIFVHGDLTSENIILKPNGELVVIDFADSKIAPNYYEYPPILFDLFYFDQTLITTFCKDEGITIHKIFKGLLIHDFGGDYVKLIYERLTGNKIESLTDIQIIKELLIEFLNL